jgi:hypothetical protein
MSSLMHDSAFDEALEREVYQEPALVPRSPWLGRAKPGQPTLTVTSEGSGSRLEAHWASNSSGKAWLWLLQTRTGGEWKREVLPGARTSRIWHGSQPDVVAVSAVDRDGELSTPGVLQARSSR